MNDNVLNILIVQECEDDVILLLAELEQKGCIPLHHRVETREDFLAALKNRWWDAVIADHVLPQFSGPEALKLLRNQGSDIPFIMVTGVFGEEKAGVMMKAGANDYILKENLSRLVPTLERELKAAQNRRRLLELQNDVQRAMIKCGANRMLEPEQISPSMNNSDSPTAATAATDNGAGSGALSTDEFPTLRELEKRHVFAALDRCKGNRTNTATFLGISSRTLRNKLHEYNGTLPKHDEDKVMKA